MKIKDIIINIAGWFMEKIFKKSKPKGYRAKSNIAKANVNINIAKNIIILGPKKDITVQNTETFYTTATAVGVDEDDDNI